MKHIKHHHALAICNKVHNMDLALFAKQQGSDHVLRNWVQMTDDSLPTSPLREYFLCQPQYAKDCLKWLNGEEYSVRMPDGVRPLSDYEPVREWVPHSAWMDVENDLEFVITPKTERQTRVLIYNNDELVAEFADEVHLNDVSELPEGFQVKRVEIDVIVK